MSDWKPSPSDIEWTRNHINRISEGGIWAVPDANNSTIQLFHSSKSYNATIYAKTPNEKGTMMRIMTVLGELDYWANNIVVDSMGVIEDSLLRDFQKKNI